MVTFRAGTVSQGSQRDSNKAGEEIRENQIQHLSLEVPQSAFDELIVGLWSQLRVDTEVAPTICLPILLDMGLWRHKHTSGDTGHVKAMSFTIATGLSLK